MRLKPVLYLCSAALIPLMFISSSSGRANIFGQDRTGSPVGGGQTCGISSCHGGSSFAPMIQVSITDTGTTSITEYLPGITYNVEVRVTAGSGNPAGYGFQAVALKASDNSNAGAFTNAGQGAQVSNANNRDYAEQLGLKPSGVFTFDWTAPAAGTGDVTFYAAGNAVNGNGGSSGDATAVLNPMTISEKQVIGLEEEEDLIAIYPNPASSVLTLNLSGFEGQMVSLEVLDISGKVMEALQFNNAPNQVNLDLETYPQGLYFLRGNSGETPIEIQRFIVH